MSSTAITPNQREIIAAQSTITGKAEYLYSTNHILNTTGGGGGGGNPPTAVLNGGVAIAVTSTAVAIASSTTCQAVVVTANSTNLANIFVGNSTVTNDYNAPTSGSELQPGQSMGIAIDNLSKVFINGTAGDGCSFVGG